MSTIVSAFISNINTRNDRNINTYYLLGKLLLKSTTPKIIFLDKDMYNLIQASDYDKKNTHIINYEKTDIYLYNYSEKLVNFNLNTDNPSKDSLEYIFAMCNKTEWIKKAIELDTFNSDNFIWIDFGLKQVCNCSNSDFIEKLNKLYLKNYSSVRIGNIWNLSSYYNFDILKQITWYFAGSVFGGDKKSLIKFAELMKNKCIEIINNYSTIVWEVNIWYMLYRIEPTLFNPYSCDHNNTIIENY